MTAAKREYVEIPLAGGPAPERAAALRFVGAHPDLAAGAADGAASVRVREVDFDALSGEIRQTGNPVLLGFLERLGKIRSFGLRNGRRQYAGYNKERKVQGRQAKAARRLGYAEFAREFPDRANAAPPDLANRVLVGDSAEALRRLPDQCVDLVLTSPPYNFGLEHADHEDTDRWKTYFDRLSSVFAECVRVLKHGGRIIVNVQPLFSDYIPSHPLISQWFMGQGLIWKGEILWEKNNYNCKYTSWGSWKSPSNPYLKYTWEFLEISCKGSLKKEGVGADADITADEFKKWVMAKWSIAPERGMKLYGHPAMFPEELAERAIKLFSFAGDVVLDPFNGAGTTTAVAHRLGRRYLGIDVSEAYCRTAEERIARQKGLFHGTRSVCGPVAARL